MKRATRRQSETQPRYPGTRAAMDGNSAVVAVERDASDAAGAYPITPSTQMGEGWAEAAAAGYHNISGRPLIFIEPEGEHAAAAVTAGMAMSGLRAANFSSGQGVAYMHESLYPAVGKRLTYVLNVGCRAITKATLNVHAGHDDYHCVDDTGFFQVFARDAQAAADLNLIAHRLAELALNPGIVAQDGFLTTHLIESLMAPERELVAEYLGRPDDIIECPTPAQRLIYGDTRRRVPELWDVDNPIMSGTVQNQDSYMQSVAAQRPFFFDAIADLADQAFNEYAELTGRAHARVMGYRADDAEYLLLGQGSVIPTAEAVVDYLRDKRGIKVGVINLVMFRPFPADRIGRMLQGRRAVTVLERVDQPLAVDPPLAREIRSSLGKCLENGRAGDRPIHAGLPVYDKLSDAPDLYSACFGLGSRDVTPGDLIGAVENMLPDGAARRMYYLSIDFLREKPLHPKDQIRQERLARDYHGLADLVVKGSESPNLMPPECVTVRMHSIGGWGAITTGKHLATTLFDLLGWHIKANPKYGSEKKGQPTTFYLAVAPEPIRVNGEYQHVDVVLSPDPNVFGHTNALAGLREGGLLIIQSDAATPEALWQHIPDRYRRQIAERNIRLCYLDAFRIAREEASDADLEQRMQGIAFQGAFFAATGLLEEHGLNEESLIDAMRERLEHKFGTRGARVVEDNLRVIRRGFDELKELTDFDLPDESVEEVAAPRMPITVRTLPASQAPLSDIQRFWADTGSLYAHGMGNDNLADPFMALSTLPASTALFRDMSGIRNVHPVWLPENCTACGNCWTVCPDTAIPGLVNSFSEILATAMERIRKHGHQPRLLPRVIGALEGKARKLFDEAGAGTAARGLISEAIEAQLADTTDPEERAELETEFGWLESALSDFQWSLTRPFYTQREKNEAGSGGLLSITINPETCKGCGECVAVCDDGALEQVTQTGDSLDTLRRRWDIWRDLPSTNDDFLRIDDLEQAIGVLDNILLKKEIYLPFTSGDGACLGCSEKTVIRLFTATVEALMQPRIKAWVARLDELIDRLNQRLSQAVVEGLDISHVDDLASDAESQMSLAELVDKASQDNPDATQIDRDWLKRVSGLIRKLESLRERYTGGTTGRGRAAMGITNATGCSSVWGSTFPYNPYPFPWANHLFQDSPSLAMGLFEGHMSKMAEGFRAVREAELELAGEQASSEDREALEHFDWRSFSDEEYALCPPVVAIGGDGAMYDIGFQNLSRLMMSGKPIKVLVLDTQVYSNTGGQACTSGFFGQVSDMAAFGKAAQGKQEVRKELGLLAMAHRTSYVLQSTIAQPSHMIEGFIEGLTSRTPAVFNCYTSCQPEHGIADDAGYAQAKLAVESRAYPLFRFSPGRGARFSDGLDLSGNPAPDADWPEYKLKYRRHGIKRELELPLTFADFAASEGRFRKHFRAVPKEAWHDGMLPLAEYLELGSDEREDRFPFIWHLLPDGEPGRLLVSADLVASCEDRRDFWRLLQELAEPAAPPATEREEMVEQIRAELIGRLSDSLLRLADGEEAPTSTEAKSTPAPSPEQKSAPTEDNSDYIAPWIDTPECSACDECTLINPRMFAYNSDGKAVIKNPDAGPYSDLVKAAERCKEGIIHPGLPRDRSASDIERWIKRGEKYN
ncbi:2-oxoacid:acceptor oxidoreductase family protein [Wenzhouxiangella sp. AB-CW3]|uniref:2-oxoacid:acceptor oxidoreductase family protein n=1 Tax=Wenzhouxiangella sp. AB-CW3 TaxID=2771012 RepID=UPI001CC2EB53|nr:2-oxoacid:acceptor oxidoreductase family protein [Wenzhouxiangella sp. AB-CW3]